MSALHEPLMVAAAEKLTAAEAAAQAGHTDSAIFGMLDGVAALGRNAAQRAWLVYHDVEDRDDRMEECREELIFQCLKTPFSMIYPELPKQVEWTIREAFEDEFLRLEDPISWAELNETGQQGPEVEL